MIDLSYILYKIQRSLPNKYHIGRRVHHYELYDLQSVNVMLMRLCYISGVLPEEAEPIIRQLLNDKKLYKELTTSHVYREYEALYPEYILELLKEAIEVPGVAEVLHLSVCNNLTTNQVRKILRRRNIKDEYKENAAKAYIAYNIGNMNLTDKSSIILTYRLYKTYSMKEYLTQLPESCIDYVGEMLSHMKFISEIGFIFLICSALIVNTNITIMPSDLLIEVNYLYKKAYESSLEDNRVKFGERSIDFDFVPYLNPTLDDFDIFKNIDLDNAEKEVMPEIVLRCASKFFKSRGIFAGVDFTDKDIISMLNYYDLENPLNFCIKFVLLASVNPKVIGMLSYYILSDKKLKEYIRNHPSGKRTEYYNLETLISDIHDCLNYDVAFNCLEYAGKSATSFESVYSSLIEYGESEDLTKRIASWYLVYFVSNKNVDDEVVSEVSSLEFSDVYAMAKEVYADNGFDTSEELEFNFLYYSAKVKYLTKSGLIEYMQDVYYITSGTFKKIESSTCKLDKLFLGENI